jgi:regulator of protease activity HflC (stomatin/prohibitin superfamily)
MFWLGLLCGLGAWLLVGATRSVFRVDEGHVAILTSFGRALRQGEGLRIFGPGLHFKWPWQRAHVVATMEQNLDLDASGDGSRAMAADGMVLRFDSILRYVAEQKQLHQYVFGLRDPIAHTRAVFTCLLRNEIANFGGAGDDGDQGSYALIRRERGNISARIRKAFESDTSERYGVRFSALDLTDVLPPDELADALNGVMNARTEADAAYAFAEAECQRRVLAAERGVEVAKARSKAAEHEARVLSEVLAELHREGTLSHYVARRRAEVLARSRAVFLRSGA